MSLLAELKRRNVIRVAVAYLVISWLVVQVIGVLLPMFDVSASFQRGVVLLLVVGFFPTIFISWAYELTPEGLKKEKDVDTSNSDTSQTAKKLDLITIASVVGIAALIGWQQLSRPETSAKPQTGLTEPVTEAEAPTLVPIPQEPTTVSNKSIAVLPFSNMSNKQENLPFTLGLHDDLLTHLSKISALKVISRTSVMEYQDTTKKIKQIADELGVANILEGGVQRAGNQIRLNVQLIDADTDEHLWAEIYDRELTTENIFKIQTEVATEIAAALKAQLTPEESKSIAAIPTRSLEAYDAYLAGRRLLENRSSESLEQALALFERAAVLDPDYAQAWIGQANTLRLLTEYSDLSRNEMFRRGQPLIEKALALDPRSSDANTAKAAYLDEASRYAEAEAAYLYAISLNPNNARAHHWYGHMLRSDLLRVDEAIVIHRKAAALDPLSSVIQINVAWSLRAAGQLVEARRIAERVASLDPDYPGAFNALAWISDDLGNFAQAVIEQEKAVALDSGNLLNRSWLAWHYRNMGDVATARAELDKARQIKASHSLVVEQAAILAMLAGDYPAALQGIASGLQAYPANQNLQLLFARFAMLSNDCDQAIAQWQAADPAMFSETINGNIDGIGDYIALAWCLQKSGQAAEAKRLLEQVDLIVAAEPNVVFFQRFSKTGILAAQGKPREAARAYAESVLAKKTRGWYWVDHLPYFAEMRKESVFIEAREQLMQDLAKQRALLQEWRTQDSTP